MAPGGRNLRRKKIQGINVQSPAITTNINCQDETNPNLQNAVKGGHVLRRKIINGTTIQSNSDRVDGSIEQESTVPTTNCSKNDGHVIHEKTIHGTTMQSNSNGAEGSNTQESIIPTMESSKNDSNLKKQVRGKTRGIGLQKIVKSSGKMVINIAEGKGRPIVAEQSCKLSNELGVIARNFMPCPIKWKEVTEEEKHDAFTKCGERFEINLEDNYVRDSCEDLLKNKSRQWRYHLKRKFLDAQNDEARLKLLQESGLSTQNFQRLSEMWEDPEHKKRCEINKNNRSKLKYNHVMGSKAFVVARSEIAEKINNGVEPDRIEFYKHTYYTEGKGWSSVDAETNYEKMKELQSKVVLEGERQLTINEIVDEVLGKKSGYVKGLGYGPKPIADASRSAHRRAIELEEALKRTREEAVNSQRELLDRVNTAETLVDTQQAQIRDLNSQLASVLTTQQQLIESLTASGFISISNTLSNNRS